MWPEFPSAPQVALCPAELREWVRLCSGESPAQDGAAGHRDTKVTEPAPWDQSGGSAVYTVGVYGAFLGNSHLTANTLWLLRFSRLYQT